MFVKKAKHVIQENIAMSCPKRNHYLNAYSKKLLNSQKV